MSDTLKLSLAAEPWLIDKFRDEAEIELVVPLSFFTGHSGDEVKLRFGPYMHDVAHIRSIDIEPLNGTWGVKFTLEKTSAYFKRHSNEPY